jgi:diguanylate cyclase (GGDEF)-like protein
VLIENRGNRVKHHFSTSELIEEAEKRKKNGRYRDASACLLVLFLRCLYKQNDLENAGKFLFEALSLLKPEDMTTTMIAKRYFLTFLTGKAPTDEDETVLLASNRYQSYVLWKYYYENDAESGIEIFRARWRENQEKLLQTKHIYNLSTVFIYAVFLNYTGEYERGLKLIHFIIEILKEKHYFMARVLLAQCFTVLANYYQVKNQNVMAENLYRKAFEIAETQRIYVFTSNIYYEAASFYSSVFGGDRDIEISERALEVSKTFSAGPQVLNALYRMTYSALYAGELREFNSCLEQLKRLAKKYGKEDAFAYACILEGNFYLYNKNYRKAEAIYQIAFQYAKAPMTLNRLQRSRIINVLLSGKDTASVNRLVNTDFDKEEFGFKLFLSLIEAKTPEETRNAFQVFDRLSARWKEESALIFYEKIGKAMPDAFERYCKEMTDLFSKNRDELSLAITCEAIGKYYRLFGKWELYRFNLEKAIALYRRIGFENAAKVLSAKIIKKENPKSFHRKINRFFVKYPDTQIEREFKIYKKLYDRNIDELSMYQILIDLTRSIDTHSDIDYILESVLKYIGDFFHVESGMISFFQKQTQPRNCFYGKEKIKTSFSKSLMASGSSPEPEDSLVVRKKIFTGKDEYLELLLKFGKPFSQREGRSLHFFLNEAEPILGLLLRSTLSFGKSIIDSLTQLNNRWFLEQRLQEEFEKSIRYHFPLSFVMTDIDDFKKINDTFGHPIGDEVLRRIGTIFRENTRKFDVTARFGGEEFAIVLPNTAPEMALVVAEKIRKCIENMNDLPFAITMSFGVTGTGTKCRLKPEELIADADYALYTAKNQGKNQTIVFSDNA